MMDRVKGKVAVITGAASGIGLACARRFAEEGSTIVGIDRDPAADWDSVTELAADSRFHQVDVTDGAALAQIARDTCLLYTSDAADEVVPV